MITSISDIKIFPVPAHNTIQLECTFNQSTNYTISLFDMQGRKVNTLTSGNAVAGIFTSAIALPDAANGMYWLSLETPEGCYRQKFIID